MCGACDGDIGVPLVTGRTCCRLGLHVNDVVRVRDAATQRTAGDGGAAAERIGVFEELDRKWGVAIVWQSGRRTWYDLSCFCPEDESPTRVTFKLANQEDFIKQKDYVLAPKEHGRGWLPHPPNRYVPRAVKDSIISSPSHDEAIEELCQPIECE